MFRALNYLTMNSKERFNEKITDMKGKQAKNVKMFSEEEYQQKIQRIKEVKMPGHKWLPRDYALVNKFEVLQVEKDGVLMERLVKVDKKDGSRKRYVTYEGLFDAIMEYHAEAGKHTNFQEAAADLRQHHHEASHSLH